MKELTALVNTYLKATTAHSSSLSGEEKLAVAAGGVVQAEELEDAGDYWRLENGTFAGEATANRRLALKKHFAEPVEVVASHDPRSEAIRLLAEGKSVSDVSKALGVDRRRVKRWATPTKI